MKQKSTRIEKAFILFLLLTTLYMPLQARYGTMSFPTCQPAPNPCYNLICNGGFEVHDTILDGSTWAAYSGIGVEFWADASGESDIQGWRRSALMNRANSPYPQHTTPDIFVQNGYGLTLQTTSPLPTAFGNTMAGIVTSEGGGPFFPQPATHDWNEGIMTDLLTPIIPGYPYELSFKAYTVNVPGLNGTLPQTYTPYKTQYVDIILIKNGGVDSLFLTTAVLIHESIAGGWYTYTHSFTLPDSAYYYGFDQIQFNGSNYDENGVKVPFYNYMNRYTFFDEFSLVGSNMVLDANTKPACNGNDGSIDLAVMEGTSPFTYSWSGPSTFSSTSQNLSGLIPGKYEVTVTDANNCIAIKEYEVFGYSTAIIYVDLNATGNNTGMNWKHAYTDLQSALARARTTCGGDIWVSEGVYYPTPSGGDPETAFEMVPSYGIYGGFKTATDDTTWLDRNWANYETILSGQLVGTYNIIRNYNIGLARDAILDGFTIQDGNSIARSGPQGAMFNGVDSPTIRHCIFKDNAAVYGSAINNLANAAQIWHCTFFNNSCDNHGGAIYNNTTTALIMNCLFYDNEAGTGGALSLSSSHDTIVNCTFTENRANGIGGALAASFSKETMIVNTIIWNNECDPNWPFFAGVVGSGVNHTGNEPIYFHSDVQNTNSINPLTGLQFTWLFKGQDAGGNWDEDPVFLDPSNKDFRLDPSSNMIDQGDNSFSSNIDYDLDSNIRIQQNDVDLGAYEVDPDFKRAVSIRSYLASKPIYEIFPNPSNGLFSIKGVREGAYFKIANLAGQIIVEKQQLFDKSIDISNYPKGVYMLIIIDKDKEISLPIMKN